METARRTMSSLSVECVVRRPDGDEKRDELESLLGGYLSELRILALCLSSTFTAIGTGCSGLAFPRMQSIVGRLTMLIF